MDTEIKIRVGGYCRITQEDGSEFNTKRCH